VPTRMATLPGLMLVQGSLEDDHIAGVDVGTGPLRGELVPGHAGVGNRRVLVGDGVGWFGVRVGLREVVSRQK
jgi:hypothetical protein